MQIQASQLATLPAPVSSGALAANGFANLLAALGLGGAVVVPPAGTGDASPQIPPRGNLGTEVPGDPEVTPVDETSQPPVAMADPQVWTAFVPMVGISTVQPSANSPASAGATQTPVGQPAPTNAASVPIG